MANEVDLSELNELARDLGDVPKNSGERLRQAQEVTARNIKDTWSGKLEGSRQLPGLPRAVDYDQGSAITRQGGEITTEIGFDKGRRQGPLGNISEFGTPRTPGRGFGAASLAENSGDYEKGIAQAIDDSLKELGL